MNAPPRPDSSENPIHYRGDTRCMMEENAGYLIKLVANSLNRMLDQEMAPLDLTAMQWRPIAMVSWAVPTRPPSWPGSMGWTPAP